MGARGRHHFSNATAFSCGPLKFRQFFSMLKTPLLSAFIPDRAPNKPVWGLFEPDLWSLSARWRLFQQAAFSTHRLIESGLRFRTSLSSGRSVIGQTNHVPLFMRTSRQV